MINKRAESDSDAFVASGPSKVSQYKALQPKRNLTRQEQQLIDSELKKWWPIIFKSKGDPIAADMASPLKSAAIVGTGAGLVGAGLGATTAAVTGDDPLLGAAAGALPLAVIAGAIAYYKRRASNRTLEDYTRRFPAGSTRNDLYTNPVFQMEEEQGNEVPDITDTAKINAALKGVYRAERYV